MYICICKGITDGQIRRAVNEGATTLTDLRKQLGVASQCGKCACQASSVISETRGDESQGLFFAAG
jgi:bacterioferritin-associated ferredoxin